MHNYQQVNQKKKIKQTTRTEQNHRNRDHMECNHLGGGEERMAEKVRGIRSINSRYKVDRGRVRIVWEMEKPKNLYVQPMGMN